MAPRARTPLRWLVAATCLAVVAIGVPSPADASTAGASVTRYWSSDAQRAVDEAREAYESARERVAGLSAQTARLRSNTEAAEAEAQRLHDEVAGEDGGFLSAVGDLLDSGDSTLDRATEAADNAELARRLADMAEGVLADSIAATEQARLAWEKAERRQARVEAEWTATEAAEAAIRRSQFQPSYDVTDPAQDRRNQRALRGWHDYLHELARNAVVPPPLADLVVPTTIAAPLEPLRDARNDLAPGLAALDPAGRPAVTVLSAEAVRAVSDAFRRVGLPDVPGAVAPATYACGGLVANVWGTSPATADLPADAAGQWDALRTVRPSSVQTGDVVILGSRADGLAETGVYVGDNQVILVDPTTGVAAVRPVTRSILGVRRVGLGPARHAAPPAGGLCAPEDTTVESSGAGPLRLPVAAGSYHLTAGFGVEGERWSTGEHTGQDFAAPTGTPVVASGSGTVTVEHPDWAGNLVRIDHGGGVETWYAHLSRVDVVPGQQVAAGDPVGLVGSLGNTSGPHLHLEVRLDGEPYDPGQVLDLPELPRPTYPNGEMPDTALCPATPDGAQLLRCDAAVAYRLLGAAYADAFGLELCITDSYRSKSGQDQVFREKPGLAALPGTSVHGLGLAVDLCGGVERFDSAENTWLLEHGPAFGWVHPDWAAAGGSRPEPWHFEYTGAAA
jgi:murein DD-endopeptidase MepM/ murein hydrolase activator NlpD